MKKALSLILVAMLLVSAAAMAEGSYTPGTYASSAEGFGGAFTVSVTVDENSITEIQIGENNETPGVGGLAVEKLPAEIVAAGSTDVDGVAGATISSTAIKAAVDKALAEAAGETKKEAKLMIPGTHKGTALGHGSEITVAVTVTGNKILSVTVEEAGDTAWLQDLPLKRIPAQIVEYQSLNVDTVSGTTFTSNGIINATKAALEKAGADIDALLAVPKPEKPAGETIELTADVIVVGGGGAGLTAAATAAETGASVIVIEKMPKIGGDSVLCGSIYNAADPEMQANYEMNEGNKALVEAVLAKEPLSETQAALQAKLSEEYEAWKASGSTTLFDSAEFHALQTFEGGDELANIDLVATLTENAYDGLQWLKANGFTDNGRITQGTGALYQRTHTSATPLGTGFVGAELTAIDRASGDVTIMVDTKATELIREDGRVTAVKAFGTQNNNQYTFKANKGIVIATGGFSANVEMRQKYNTSGKWPELGADVLTTNPPSSTGDGIVMAEAIGANLVDMDQIQFLYLASPRNGSTSQLITTRAGVANWMAINKRGERFVAETERRDVLALALMQQPDGVMYTLLNSNIWNDESLTASDGTKLSDLVARGIVIKGETLDELAEKLGMDPAVLKDTVDKFNAAVDAGKDEFGRTLFAEKLINGPWYADARMAGVHHTMGGIEINTKAQVLDTEGNVIPGLFAAGEVTGDIHGSNRLGGNAVVDTVVFGRIAGASAVAD